MIQYFLDKFMENKSGLAERFAAAHPGGYEDIVRMVVELITEDDRSYGEYTIDPQRIHSINDGDYQGTLLFVIAAKGYQPDDYWYVKVSYGSCSGCDTLESIRGYADGPPDGQQVADYMTLALHIAQGLRKCGED